MTTPPTQELVAAARYEIDRRAESYPRLVVEGRLDPDAATLDFQAWHGIAEWLATGHCQLIGCAGGVNTEQPRLIEWDLLEESADKGLAAIRRLYRDEAAFAAAPNDPNRQPLPAEQLESLAERGRRLAQICRAVANHRRIRDQLNAELRGQANAKERKAA